MAGIVTTSNNHHPEVITRIQQEVDKVIGSNRQVSLRDRENLQYTRAAIFESLRYCTLVAFGLPHAPTKPTTLLGCDIPKGTTVITNFWAVHHDSDFWDLPWEYCPERFLDADGHLVPADHQARKHLFAFGAGGRKCIGSVLALNRMLVFTASLMQKFDLSPDPEVNVSYDPRSYIQANALRPKPYKIKLIPRQ